MDPLERRPEFLDTRIFVEPVPGHVYLVGADPAEGVAGGDDSGLCIVDATTRRQVAAANPRLGPKPFANLTADLCEWFNDAYVLPERNNHGHAFILQLEFRGVSVIDYTDDIAGGANLGDYRPGYPKSGRSKVAIWDATDECFRTGGLVIVDYGTYIQLGAIDRAKLKGPPGAAVDDLADAVTFCVVAMASPALWGDIIEAAERW